MSFVFFRTRSLPPLIFTALFLAATRSQATGETRFHGSPAPPISTRAARKPYQTSTATVPALPPLTPPAAIANPEADLGADLDTLVGYKPTGKPVVDANVTAAMTDLNAAVTTPRKLDPVVRARLDALLVESKSDLEISPRKPVSQNDPLRWVLVNYESILLLMTSPAATVAYSNASDFPGAVPSGTSTVTRQVTIDTTTGPGAWRSTGLYAAPGALITLTTDAPLAGKGFMVRIGAHSDSLRNRQHRRYLRMPDISRVFAVRGTTVTAANAFGGLIYVVVPPDCNLGPITVTVRGAVPAPYYVEGKTTAAEWMTIRNNPAPWGELEAKDVIFTVPSSDLRKVDDPAALAAFWDKTIASVADFMGRPAGVLSFTSTGPSRPERYVADVDISAGGMHAGYPIMTFLNAVPTELDLAMFRGLRPGSKTWGLLHELGHNYQTQVLPGNQRFRDWTTVDAGEVTNNMAPLYIAEQMGLRWQAVNPALLMSRATALAGIAAGQKPWQGKDLFVKLYMYVELSDTLGWKPIHEVFADDYAEAPADRPKTDPEKRDRWLVQLSKASGKNLGPFLSRWGYDTSDAARASVANLPTWLPEEWTAKAPEHSGAEAVEN